MGEMNVKSMATRKPFSERFMLGVRAVWQVPSGRVGAFIIAILVFVAIFCPLLAPHDPLAQSIANRFASPSSEHIFGTDYLGRDIFTRLLYGCRIAMLVAFGATTISAVIGTIMGVTAGFKEGGKIDYIMIFIFDVIRSFPQIILALALVAVLGSSIPNMIFALGVTVIPYYGRIARAQTLATRQTDYVRSAKALGVGSSRIIFRHILPNITSPLLICMGMDMVNMIIYESGLSFLGLGVVPPDASWGTMLSNGYKYVDLSIWLILMPIIMLAVAMTGFSLLSEGMRVALDPKARERIKR